MALPLAACLAVVVALQAPAQPGRKDPAELKAGLTRDFAKGADLSGLDFTGQAVLLVELLEQARYVQAGREPGDERETYVAFVRSVARRLGARADRAVELYGERVRPARAAAAAQRELDARAALAEDVRRNPGISAAKKARLARDLGLTSEHLRMGLNGDANFVGGPAEAPAQIIASRAPAASPETIYHDSKGERNWSRLPPQVEPIRLVTNPTPSPEAAPSAPGIYDATLAYVSESLDAAERYLTGAARGVRNYFYSGIELIQGYGYTFIHAGRRSNWGTKPLVDGLRKIGAYMRGTGRAESDLKIGDISSANGGKLGGHLSHKTGRDVDIGFYMVDEAGKPVDAPGFVRFTSGRDGLTGYLGRRTVRFDAQRNWFLVQAILANDDPGFTPAFIFIDKRLETAILAAAGDSPERGRAAALMSQWPGHDNHLHLRVK